MTLSKVEHAGLLAVRTDGLWRGALVRGPSGVGKSDLALRALGAGFRLIADDQTVVFVSQGRLFGRAPTILRGLLEARGVGIIAIGALPLAEVVLVADCAVHSDAVERLPEPQTQQVLGLDIPILRLVPTDASSPAKLSRAISRLGAQRQQGYQAALRPGAWPIQGGWREL